MAACASPRHFHPSGTRRNSEKFNHRFVCFVPLRWARHAELHPVAVDTHDARPSGIGNDQQIYLDAILRTSYRESLHWATS